MKAEREGYNFDATLSRVLKDTVRSCNRGRGAPLKPMALPVVRLGELTSGSDRPWSVDGPVGPGRAILLGSWFMMREQEMATTRACLVTLTDEHGETKDMEVTWTLPASKNDVEAAGVSRSHGCCCTSGGRAGICPYHAAVDQMKLLKKLFPTRFADGVADSELPFFPSEAGVVVGKLAMVETIIQAAEILKVPKVSADGSERVSGHSLRVTGAQGLVKAGLEVWAVQLLGRWGSDTVLSYVRSVPLQRSSEWARRAMENTLEQKLVQDKAVTEENLKESRAEDDMVRLQHRLERELKTAKEAEKVHLAPRDSSCFVRSARGAFHKVGQSEGCSPMWVSACGWRFCSSEATLFFNELPEDAHYKFLCAKCLPGIRAARKAALEAI